jgi:hypothetical protein
MALDHRNSTRELGSSGIDFATLIEVAQARMRGFGELP